MSLNPYDFIPLEGVSDRTPPPGHHYMAPFAGVIHARLTTCGHFLIARQHPAGNSIVPLNNGKIIPGSSIKGMIRNMAEIVGGGCISMSGSLYPRGKYGYRHAQEPKAFSPCNNIQKLCVTCRMFGFIERSNNWKGMIQIGEGVWQGTGNAPPVQRFNVIVGTPKPDHHSFYTRDNKVRGRKAYYHHPDNMLISTAARNAHYGAKQTLAVSAVRKDQSYDFSVHHQGLNQQEYALLLYSLFLEEGLAHKFGWGKPMGFGSVKIEPLLIEEIDLAKRYRKGGSSATIRYEASAAVANVEKRTESFRNNQSRTIEALRKVHAFPGMSNTEFKYPTYSWFKENPQKTLEDFNLE